MKKLPINEKAFDSDIQLKKMITTLESYIEINNEMESVSQALLGLYDSSYEKKEKPKMEFSDEEIIKLKEVEKELSPLIEVYNESRDPFQIMRDTLWEIRDEIGTHSTLFLINNKLVMSLELLLSGAIVTYAKSFNESQRRTRLNAHKIFKDKKQFEFHQYLIELRNKHYAHSEYELTKHTLSFILMDKTEKIDLNIHIHSWTELWAKFDYAKFFGLLKTIKNYLETEIIGKSKTIRDRLTLEQIEVLKSAY